ncbi:VOC family protein [Nonomuraea africana]|uniref:Lactoylglutathione lyase n=1 Tax=Nonomuraea africana TaxID=46171 RepID=A0ABR9KRH2_9ACTN|nr:VOC family protein [Nonomuraea africana]MBE1564609.1 putative lactoylglutathione lyase [Nonomuraea africana]
MSHTLFVNLPVKDLSRSKAFFTELGLTFFGATEDMASVVISEQTQVMLLAEPTFAGYSRTEVADPTKTTQVILVLGLDNPQQVDELVGKAMAAGAEPVGEPVNDGYRYQRGFADLDGHHWAALCLVTPAG